MKTYRLLVTVSLFLFGQMIMAQSHTSREQGKGSAKNGVVGKILDSETEAPVPFTSIALYKESDSTLVTGTISKENGRFFIEATLGEYYIVVNFMGYQPYTYSKIKLTSDNPIFKVGAIKLERTASEIDGVEIVASQAYVEYKIDRKIVNVERDMGASGATAVDALENVPSVSVDIEGNVQLRGSGNFTVLVNGKPSPLSGSDALEQIPTSAIKNIEIITNPSAKFDPDGMTGIINVVLKEDVQQGLNGFVEASVRSFEGYSFNTLFNYRKKKFNYFAGFDTRQRNSPGDGSSSLDNYASDTIMYRDTYLDRLRSRNNSTFKGGIDYFADSKNTMRVDAAYGVSNSGKDYDAQIYERTDPSTYHLYTISDNLSDRESEFYRGSFTWQRKLKREGEKLEFYAFLKGEQENKEDDQKESYSDIDWNTGSVKDWYNTSDNEENKDFRMKLDYTLKLKGDRKFESGLQSRSYRQNSEFIYMAYDTLNEMWFEQPNYGNIMTFNRDIYSGYATYGGMHKSFGYQLGLRGEYTYRVIDSEDSYEGSTINRFDLFPTIHLSQKFAKTNSVLLSYSRRIDRPSGWELSPNPTFISSNFVRQGNPDLEPEYTDNLELSYQKTINKSFVSLEAYYRTTKNKISRVQEMDEYGTIYMTYENLDRDQAAGMELMTNFQFYKWFRMNFTGSYYYYKLEGDISTGAIEQTSNNYNFRLNLNFMITSKMRFQVNGFYRGPSATAQGEMQEFYILNSALRYDFFNHKMAVTFNVKDVLSSRGHAFETITPTFSSQNQFWGYGPIYSLTASYKINNYKQSRRPSMEDRGEGGDDI